MTYRYIILAAICAVIWVMNGRHIADGVRNRISFEIYAHSGLGIFFTLLALEYVLGGTGLWREGNILWVRILGFALYVPAAIFVFGSMIELHRKGKAGDSDALSSYGTTVVVESGVFRVVRHPMWLGMSIWSVALILISQSVPAIVLGILALNLFRVAAVKETEFNIEKFGALYWEYIERVPMWNIFRGLRR
jgi:protein-S-isoprenylcysteine O-methyltransferase Ste14